MPNTGGLINIGNDEIMSAPSENSDRPITVLALESSCDETAAAVVRLSRPDNLTDGTIKNISPPMGEVLSNIVLSQIDLHAPYGGVVPEIAARAHITHMDRLVAQALDESGLGLDDMDAIAATAGPGLIGGVLIGLTTGKALALAAGKKFIGINHLEGHALTARLTDKVAFPYLLLLVSGGHCQLLAVKGVGDYHVLGGTFDDAVGEAFDKAAKLLSLGYPGGPQIEQAARDGDSQAVSLPRPLLDRAETPFDFSFSGLKTALRQQAEKAAPLSDRHVADLAAAFQQAVIDCLCDRAQNAMTYAAQNLFAARGDNQQGPHRLVVAGGVAANQALRQALQHSCAAHGFELHVPPPALCTDNAAMIGWAAAERLAAQADNKMTPDKKALSEKARSEKALSEKALSEKAMPRWPLDSLTS